MSKEVYNEDIDRFLRGELEGQAANTIKKKMETDPAFKKEVEYHELLLLGIQTASQKDLKTQLLERNAKIPGYERKDFLPSPTLLIIKRISLAAAILFLGFLLFKFINTDMFKGPEKTIQAALNKKPEISLTSLGDNANTLKTAQDAFNDQNYESALQHFDQYLLNNPTDYEALFYKGVALRYLRKSAEAEKVFTDLIASQEVHLFAENARYELALSYLQHQDFDKAIPLLNSIVENPSSDWKEEAEKLLKAANKLNTNE